MKKFFFLLIVGSLFVSLQIKSNIRFGGNELQEMQYLPDSVFVIRNFISVSEAQKIIGQPCYAKDSLIKRTGDYQRYQFNYRATMMDTINHYSISLFFGFEQYKSSADAAHAYSLVKTEDEKTLKVIPLSHLGDEAFLCPDAETYPFIMIRKSSRVYKLKLHYLSTPQSLEALKAAASRIVATY